MTPHQLALYKKYLAKCLFIGLVPGINVNVLIGFFFIFGDIANSFEADPSKESSLADWSAAFFVLSCRVLGASVLCGYSKTVTSTFSVLVNPD